MNIAQVVGGPGSGKTTLVYQLLEDWPGASSLMRVDRYLRNRQSDDGDDFLLLPTSIDWPLIMNHLEQLRKGSRVFMPLYDWKAGRRLTLPVKPPADHIIHACDWLIVEGLFYLPEIESVRLFVDSPAAVRRNRSQARETRLSQHLGADYDKFADVVYEKYILPQRDLADHVVDGTLARDKLADTARRLLASHWAGWG